MSAKYSDNEIFDYWTDQVRMHGQSPTASWSDHYVIELEIKQILERLSDGDTVLDVGCANGYSSTQFAAARKIRLRGLDYIPEMIEQARLRGLESAKLLMGSIDFAIGDVTSLHEKSSSYDKVIAVRVLINLGSIERQLKGLNECIRVLRPGGILLLSEATLQGWKRLNLLRRECGLEEIPMPDFNQYLDENEIIRAAEATADLVEISNFASSYYVGTRVMKPLLVRAGGFTIDVGNPNTEWNRFCSQLPAVGDYGTQKLLVFRKR
jgi:ubiquinone/menaquinone biosynthesis C-methylase UbiE